MPDILFSGARKRRNFMRAPRSFLKRFANKSVRAKNHQFHALNASINLSIIISISYLGTQPRADCDSSISEVKVKACLVDGVKTTLPPILETIFSAKSRIETRLLERKK